MARSSSLAFVLVAAGGAAVGFLVAQVIPLQGQDIDKESAEHAEVSDQQSRAEAIVGLDQLILDEQLRGEITSASELNGNDGSRFTRYAASLEEGEIVEISLRGALQGVVALYDDQLQLLDHAPVVRHRVEESGDYVVVISGADAHSYGPFTVDSRAVELTDADTVTVGEPVDSWLQGDAREITLNIEEAGLYQLEMRSDDFDPYLELAGPNGYAREDDDSAGELDARIADFLEAGEYTLTARSAYGDGNGVYTLSVEPHELPGDGELRNDGPLTADESLNGWYSGQALNYQVEIEEAGMYEIEMTASDIDSYLVLEGPNGYYREDDDSAGELNASIADFLAPGVYELTARTAYGESSGMFTLSMKPHDMPDVELRNEGAIMPGEPLNGWYSGEPLNYQLEVTESSLVTLEMRSADFDTFIEISGQGVAASDDDGAGGTDSRLQEPLLPGTYTVSARGFSATGSGLFELSLEMEPADIPPDL
ncbi:hypothetical protein DQ400_05430 [Vreelandella sulfidaeris]|uniref:Peptidase C-terminal archaeal/bacterial domain-containing protein n=1 Tax=Vreelandella sulfidaeris TaxID=115553 RepID=A0A365TRZ8_9GAMM|nr:hypothetical protein [Halomonas sulfidaeris]RBI68808.1 hypothetical protein DQ400_05430 [Halomonas sulfidaeris]